MTCCQQCPILTEDPLHDDTTPIARPWALHLCKHPFIGAHLFGIMEIDGTIDGVKIMDHGSWVGPAQLGVVDLLIERDHHANLGLALHLFHGATAFKVVEFFDMVFDLWRQLVNVINLEWKPP